jgi:hypothetical protein
MFKINVVLKCWSKGFLFKEAIDLIPMGFVAIGFIPNRFHPDLLCLCTDEIAIRKVRAAFLHYWQVRYEKTIFLWVSYARPHPE